MNRDEIMIMQPGRELDALVAEKVMGWKRAVTTDGATEYWDNGSFCSGKWVEPVTDGFRLDDYSNTWNPSESISAAWEVVGKLNELRLWVDISQGTYTECEIGRFGIIKKTLYKAKGSKAPEAISKAALLALIQEDTP